jgi:hypothetical protein
MADPSGADPSGAVEEPLEVANRLAAEIAPMVRLARAGGFEFLAYLLGMALKESRRISEGGKES